MIHENTLLQAEVKTLREVNSSLVKRWRAKKTRLRQGGTLEISVVET